MAKARRESKRAAFSRQHVRQHQTSGLTVRAYCQQHQLGEASFYAWRRTLAERDREATTLTALPTFVPVRVTEPTSTSDVPLEIHWADGRCLRVRARCDRTLLADVLALLEGR